MAFLHSFRSISLFCGILAVAVPCRELMQSTARAGETNLAPKVETKEADPRAGDRASVRAAMTQFVKSFKTRDAKGLASLWTADGEYENEQAVVVHGRAALERAFTEFFSKTPEIEGETQPESLRFLSRDAAIEEGIVRVRRGSSVAPTAARYSALFTREDGKWLLARLQESSMVERSTVADLEWLIGDWKSVDASGAEILAKYTWAPNRKFILVHFTIKEKELTLSGNQVIGVDPATDSLRTWTFEANGGVAEAHWEQDGDHWVLDAVGNLPDGRALTETNILRRINNNTFTFQSIHRMLGEEQLPDLAPVKVARVSAKAQP
ncbi:MAG: SgcJ/EcaC family oxidoreductase [Planctomycetota bacterium]